MSRNIEVKARIDSVDALQPRAAALADRGPELLQQDDTFFACANGRLKLRAFGPERGELIFYRRADTAGPKLSDYRIVPTTQPDALRAALADAYGETGRVRKQRILFLAGRTRVHLDRVEGLGDFLELEVVLADGETEAEGVAEAHELLAKLGVGQDRLLEVAYVDLLNAAQATRASAAA